MPKWAADALKVLEKLIDEYSTFQRRRPDVPQGSLPELSEEELEQVVSASQLYKSREEELRRMERSPRLH